MTGETKRRIEDGLATWDQPNSDARKRFEACQRRLATQLEFVKLEESIKRSDPETFGIYLH